MNPKSHYEIFSAGGSKVEITIIEHFEVIEQVGSKVKHLSGGPEMIISGIFQQTKDVKLAYCDRYVGPEFKREAFNVRCLKLV